MCDSIVLCICMMLIFTLSESLEGDLFRSSAHLQQALVKGNKVLKQIDVKHVKKKATKTVINRYLGYYNSLSEKSSEGIIRHPIYIYCMIRDLYQLRQLKNTLPYQIDTKDLPTKDDFNGTVNALVRLQYTYKLKTDDMAAGIIAGEQAVELLPEDCLAIGEHAVSDNKLEQAIDWLNKALTLKSAKTKTLEKKIYSIKCKSEYQLGMRNEALKSVNRWLRIDKDDSEATEMKEKILRLRNQRIQSPQFSQVMQTYMKLCRGEETQESKNVTIMSRMYCRFHDNKRHPLLILQPAREEDVNADPHMKVYRDVLSESEMRTIRELTIPKLQTSKVIKSTAESKKHKSDQSDARISKGYFFDISRPKCKKLQTKLYRRLQAITGLQSVSYENLQVSNYGIGGYYYSHYDWTPKHQDPHHNDRIATVLFYLNEVEAGGATVFPRIGVRMAPEKGDGIFWYNLHRNGIGDEKTFHAGCPVLLGTKWVANAWIGRHHQEFIRPCTLNKHE